MEQIVENDIFDIKKIEDTCKLDIDCQGLLEIFEKYSYKTEMKGTKVEDKKIFLPILDRVEITMNVTKMLLSNLQKSFTGLPKNKNAMLKKISSIIRMYASSNEINADYKQTLDRNKQVRFWILDLLQFKGILISEKFMINKDKMLQYLEDINSISEE